MWSQIVGLSFAIILTLQPLSPVVATDLNQSHARPGSRSAQPVQSAHPPASQWLIADYHLPTHPQPHTTTRHPSLPAICSSSLQLQDPTACPNLGPGEYASQIVAAGLPYPFPSLTISPVHPYRGLTPAAYAKVITSTAPVYRHP